MTERLLGLTSTVLECLVYDKIIKKAIKVVNFFNA